MDRSTKNLVALFGFELFVVAVLGYLAFVEDVLDVTTMVYVVVGLSILTTPVLLVLSQRHVETRTDEADR